MIQRFRQFLCVLWFFLLLQDLSSLHGAPLGPKQSFHLLFQPVMRYSRVQDRATQPFINEVDIDSRGAHML